VGGQDDPMMLLLPVLALFCHRTEIQHSLCFSRLTWEWPLRCILGQLAFVVCRNSLFLHDPHSWPFTTEALLTTEPLNQKSPAATNKHHSQSCAAPTVPLGGSSMCLLISTLLQHSCVKLLNSHLI